jgi:hypothetical protein
LPFLLLVVSAAWWVMLVLLVLLVLLALLALLVLVVRAGSYQFGEDRKMNGSKDWRCDMSCQLMAFAAEQ